MPETTTIRPKRRPTACAAPEASLQRASFVMLDLTGVLNNNAISHAAHLDVGGLNIWRNSYPADELPEGGSIVDVGGVPFRFPPTDGADNNVICCGQLLDTPAGRYDWIYVLGAAERRTEDWTYLHYVSGAVDPEWLRLSDFWPAASRFGEVEAFRCRRMHYPRHIQEGVHPGMWRARIPVPREDELARLRLPHNIAIHIFAMTLARPDSRRVGSTSAA